MRINLLSLIFFFLLTIIITSPLIFHLNTLILDRNDGLLITWIINWNVHSFSSGLPGILNYFNANIFFPYHNTLAFSDYHFLSGLIALPFVFLSGEPLIGYNINFLLGFTLTAWAMFILVKQLTGDIRSGLLSGTLFGFSMIHLSYMTHLQLFDFYPVLFTLIFLFKHRFLLFTAMIILSTLNMPLNFFFLLSVIAVYLLTIKKERKEVIIATSVASIISGICLLPYILVSQQFHYVRPIQDAIHFSLSYHDLININESSRLFYFLQTSQVGTPAFFGAVFLALILVMFWQRVETFHLKSKNPYLTFSLILAAVSFIFSFGPAFHVFKNTIHVGIIPAIPMPYLLFYYLLPGFSAFRTPSRWILLTACALAIAIGIHFKRKISSLTLVFLIILILLEINIPFSYVSVPLVKDFPPEQVWLKSNHPGQAIIQFPIFNWPDPGGISVEAMREYYSTIHFRPMFNGFSGYSPKEWQDSVGYLQNNFPSVETLQFLKHKYIKLIVVPTDWETRMQTFEQVQLIERFPNTIIYEIR